METDTTYTPPELIAEVDDDVIHARMLENLPDDIDKTDGGFAHDFTRPAALEKAELLVALNDAIQVFFPEWSYGGYLDKLAASAGLMRRQATAASGELTVTGAEGTTFPVGFRFCTPSTAIAPNVEFEVTEAVTINSAGTATVHVACTETGTVGNVPANCVTLMSAPIGGVATITNPEPITGGAETETDEALRARIMEKDRNNESSFVGCDSDYKRWALEVDGIGTAIVVPEWQGAGTGTVKLVVMDANGQPASNTLMTAVYNHIISPDNRDERLAPIGAILTVATCSAVAINVSATITLEEGVTALEVTSAFTEALKAYFEEAKAEGYVRYTRVGSVLSETAGVVDYTGLLINNTAANIAITVDDYPTVGTINLTDTEA